MGHHRTSGAFALRRLLAAPSFLACTALALAQGGAAPPPDGRSTIDRGLAFLVKDAVAWKSEHGCVSCHHAGLVLWSLQEAKQYGIAVDEPFLAQLTQWIAESGDGKTGLERPAAAPRALNTKAVYLALGLGADPRLEPAHRPGLELLLKTVEADQIEDGSWSAWPETRAPLLESSDESMTALAALAVTPAAAVGGEAARAAGDRAIQWLSRATSEGELQSLALRLVLSRRAGRPAAEREPWLRRLRERQAADGGWSQAQELPSDAWATGQALYALAHAGVPRDDPAVERARAFLVATQRDDGSWPMASRPIQPGGTGAKNLVPITGAGSAWAILGLVRVAGGSRLPAPL